MFDPDADTGTHAGTGATADDAPASLAERRATATRAAIVDAAWRLSRRHGLTGWSLRQLAGEVGCKAPTLYAYVDGKQAIYDAMFRAGYEAFAALTDEFEQLLEDTPSVREGFRLAVHRYVAFCTEDPVRYQLMFQRVVPDFEPGPEAYAASLRQFERMAAQLAAIGIDDPAAIDLWTALATGLTDQQLSNDPGGDRWIRLVDRACDMYLDHVGVPDEGDRP